MAKKEQSGGVNIQAGAVNVGGDIVGRDKITDGGSAALAQRFAQILKQIESRPADPDVDQDELKSTVQRIEQEVKKGQRANPNKVERWLKFLAAMADDIFQVTAATLANPAAGVAKAVQLIAKKAQES